MQAASSAKRSEGRASLLAQRVSVRLAMHRAWGPCLVWGDPRAGEQLRPGATATELSLGPGATTTERGAPEPVTDGAPVSSLGTETRAAALSTLGKSHRSNKDEAAVAKEKSKS